MDEKRLLLCPGPGDLLCRLDGAWLVCMGGQLITMGMGMRRVLFWEHGLFYRLMLRVREWSGDGVMPGIFELAIAILARACFFQSGCIRLSLGVDCLGDIVSDLCRGYKKETGKIPLIF